MLHYEYIDPEKQFASEDFKIIESFLKETNRTQIGWHYISDIIWMYSHIKDWPRNFKILDAGGGPGGPIQFLMAELGFDVTNIDINLNKPEFVYQRRYQCAYKILESLKNTDYETLLAEMQENRRYLKNLIKQLAIYKSWEARRYSRNHDNWRKCFGLSNTAIGRIKWVKGNLCEISEIRDNTFDAVVSLSALEHIHFDSIKFAVEEIKRVIKPEAHWAVTTSGTERAETWFHKQSQSNCFSSNDLEEIFNAISDEEQNPQEVLEKYIKNRYLRDNLAKVYFKSGKYGMPWGKWDPQYIPVGIYK